MTDFRPAIVVPHYNHHRQFAAGLPALLGLGTPIIVVDDGSDQENLRTLQQLTDVNPGIELVSMPRNRGKGAAVKTGLTIAASRGFTHAMQIDADGQHAASDGSKLLAVARDNPAALVCGRPVFDESIPKARLRGRKFTQFWVVLETLGNRVKDAMCGFRVYPLAVIEPLVDGFYTGPRMDFDIEILVKADWLGVPMIYVETQVQYPEDGISHFDYLRDNIDITLMHTRLMFGMLPRSGKLVWRLIFGR